MERLVRSVRLVRLVRSMRLVRSVRLARFVGEVQVRRGLLHRAEVVAGRQSRAGMFRVV